MNNNTNYHNYTTLAAARSFTNEGISNVPTNLVNIETQEQVLGSMQNYQDKESPLIMFGGDEQAGRCGCYEQLMMFANGGNINNNVPQQKQTDVSSVSNYCDFIVSNVLDDYNMSSDVEEIKQLISTNNLNLFVDENKTVRSEEEKVLMYY